MAGRLVLAATLAASVLGTSVLLPSPRSLSVDKAPTVSPKGASSTLNPSAASYDTNPWGAVQPAAQPAPRPAPPKAAVEVKDSNGLKLKPFDKIPEMPSGPISDANCETAGGMCSSGAGDPDCGPQNSLGLCEDYISWCCAVTVDEREDRPIVTGDAIDTHPVVRTFIWNFKTQIGANKKPIGKVRIGKPYSREMQLFDGQRPMVGKEFDIKGPDRLDRSKMPNLGRNTIL